MTPRPDPFPLDPLAARIRRSSNFRFNWQFYQTPDPAPRTSPEVRDLLLHIIDTPSLHHFLRSSFDPMYEPTFRIERPHEHARLVPADGDLKSLLAAAAGDHLGAYSELRPATPSEQQEVQTLFGSIGPYAAFQLLPGDVTNCATCRVHNHHLFTNWFFGVAWDWCLFAAWPALHLFWIGCLTDTD